MRDKAHLVYGGFFQQLGDVILSKDNGKQPEDREEFTREVKNERVSAVVAWRREEGIDSRAQVVG